MQQLLDNVNITLIQDDNLTIIIPKTNEPLRFYAALAPHKIDKYDDNDSGVIILDNDDIFMLHFGNSGVIKNIDYTEKMWNFAERYPNVIPILIEKGYLKKCEFGFEIVVSEPASYDNYSIAHVTCDIQLIHRITKYSNGDIFYSKYGKLHRVDGPAFIWNNGRNKWYINDKDITDDVDNWLIENNYTVPFDKPAQDKFILKFAG